MKILRVLTLLHSDDDDQKEKGLDSTFQQVVSDPTIATKGVGLTEITVPANGNVQLPFGSIATARRALLVSDSKLNVTLNNGSDAVPLLSPASTTYPVTDRSKRAVAWIEGELTKIVLTNPGATNATVLFALAGV